MMLIVCVTLNAQTTLNESGEYELKVVEQYAGVCAASLYERTLLVLSDIMGSNKQSKTNIDVKDKEGGIIVFKVKYYLGYRKVNISGGYNYYADLSLKVRCKEEKVQYTFTVPSLYLDWNDVGYTIGRVLLSDVIPEYKYKGKLYYVKKGLMQYSASLDESINSLKDLITSKTKAEADNDDF